MDYKRIAQEVLVSVGGKGNVSGNATCMTRLRVTIKDFSKVNMDGLKKIEGVMGVVESDTLQIVFGPGKVNKVGAEFSDLTGISLGYFRRNKRRRYCKRK